MTARKTIAQFIAEKGIAATAVRTDERPGFVPYTEPFSRRPVGMAPTPSIDADNDGWAHYAWYVTLSREGVPSTLSTPYKQGIAHVEKTTKRTYVAEFGETLPRYAVKVPTVEDVLDSLSHDSSSYDNSRSFEEWASDLGYDPDSRKAYATYQTLAEQAKLLRHFLGDDAYKELLWDVEGL